MQVVYADPPWKYNARNNPGTKFGGGTPYPTMTLEELKQLPVQMFCFSNCALAMWTTGPRIPEAVELIEAWGFRYATILFTWVKTTKAGTYRLGPGYYTGSNAELCLLGVRGSMPPVDKGVRQVIAAPVGRHSKKPEEAYERLEALWPDAWKVELFARNKREGWFAWGNEIEPDFVL